jgi:hypothetical protein
MLKTSLDDVTEVRRHGIVHGSLINYDNAIVATKRWNMVGLSK